MDAYQLSLPESASARIEALLAGLVCPVHVGTTLDGGSCAMCELRELHEVEGEPRMTGISASYHPVSLNPVEPPITASHR